VEVNSPPVAFDVISDFLATAHVDAGNPEHLAARRLEIKPDSLAVPAPPLVTIDLHINCPLVHQAHLTAVGADGPGAIELVPGTLVAVEQQIGIDWIELHVVQIAILKAG